MARNLCFENQQRRQAPEKVNLDLTTTRPDLWLFPMGQIHDLLRVQIHLRNN